MQRNAPRVAEHAEGARVPTSTIEARRYRLAVQVPACGNDRWSVIIRPSGDRALLVSPTDDSAGHAMQDAWNAMDRDPAQRFQATAPIPGM